MSAIKIPCWYYPSSVVFLDDDKDFLATLLPDFAAKMNIITENKPAEAFELLQKRDYSNIQPVSYTRNSDEMNPEADHLINLDIFELHKNIYNSNRFNTISVLVVDYRMPQTNGVEFCDKIKNLPLKKIMLTGVNDYGFGIQAFNNDLINKFVLKNNLNLTETLMNIVQSLQYDFFCEHSLPILNSVISSGNTAILVDEYLSLFNAVRSSQGFVEFYLLDINGSYLFLDADAQPTWLMIKCDADIQEYIDIAIGNDASPEIIQSLKSREKLPFFFAPTDKQELVSKWSDYLFPAQKLGNSDYYYAVVNGKTCNNIAWSDVQPFKQHKLIQT